MISTNKQQPQLQIQNVNSAPSSPLSIITNQSSPSSIQVQSQYSPSLLIPSTSSSSSTSYTLLNALITILSSSERINRKQQAQIDNFINFWRVFDLKSTQRNINELVLNSKIETVDLYTQFNELSNELNKTTATAEEEADSEVSPILNKFQNELDNLNKRIKLNETTVFDLSKIISNIQDPLPLIELIIHLNNDFNQKVEKYENDNKQLREALDDYSNEINLINRHEPTKQYEKDKELIKQLYEQISKTTSLNLDLNAKLEVAESEIESYKKILSNYQSKISEMKIKCIADNNNNNNNNDVNNSINENDKTNNNNNKYKFNNTQLNRSSNSLLIADTTKQNKWNNGTSSSSSNNNNSSLLSPSSLNNNQSSNLNNNRSTRSQDVLTNSTNTKMLAQSPISQATTLSLKSLLNKDKLNDEQEQQQQQLSPTASASSPPLLHFQHIDETINNNNVLNYEPLNTSDIAQRVRDLLSLHNIGQRIFAKYVLGLSQGTVSELLSKPKHWDKLTEKGRESYRKMHTWSLSDESINALKAISPRKGNKDNYFYQNGKEDTATEEKIAQILNEAQKQMQKNTSTSINGLNRSSSKPQLFNNGEQKLFQTDMEKHILEQIEKFKSLIQTNVKQQPQHHDESEYDDDNEDNQQQQEEEYKEDDDDDDDEENTNHSDINNNNLLYDETNKSNNPLDLTVKVAAAAAAAEIKSNLRMKRQYSYETGLNAASGETNGNELECKIKKLNNNNNSPLSQMQTIANSFLSAKDNNQQLTISSSSSASSSSTSPSPMPTSLQQQNLNVLNNLKSSLSPSPISNNSGSYLTSSAANTTNNFNKPLKSVLPPVSQEQFDKYSFISTEDLVKKVKDLLSKYSISQRLFGEYILGLSQGSVSDLLARPKPWMMLTQKGREPFIRMQMFIDDNDAIKKLMSNQYKIPSEKFAQQQRVGGGGGQFTPTSNSSFVASQLNGNSTFSQQSNDNSNDDSVIMKITEKPLQQQQQQQHQQSYSAQLNIIPYDISSLTSNVGDINTEEITNKVKETLLNNNIGQKLFGEAVLNLSQGTVSELLSKPKPWNTLSIKGREPYLRMYMWLNDPLRLEKLNEWKEERNSLKRTNTEVENDQQKPKRRFIFTEEQKEQLMKAFRFDPYPSVNQMELLAGMLNLATRTVINWFHNHRMRIRYKNNSSSSSSVSGGAGGGGNNRQSPLLQHAQAANHQNNSQNKFSLEHYTAMSKLKYSSNASPYSLNGFKSNGNNGKYNYNDNTANGSNNGDEYVDDIIDDDDNMTTDENYDYNMDNDTTLNTTANNIYDGEDDDDANNNNQNDDDQHENEMNSLFINNEATNSSEHYNSNDENSNDSTNFDTRPRTNNTSRQLYSNTNNNNTSNLLNNSITQSNKRRKPNNPQKLTTTSTQNNKLFKKQDEIESNANDDLTTTTSGAEPLNNDNIAVH